MARQEHALIHRFSNAFHLLLQLQTIQVWKHVSEKISWNCVETYLKSVLCTKQGTPNSMVPASCGDFQLALIQHANLRGPPRPYAAIPFPGKSGQKLNRWLPPETPMIYWTTLVGLCNLFTANRSWHNFPGLLTFASGRLHLEVNQGKTMDEPKKHIYCLSHLFKSINMFIKIDIYTMYKHVFTHMSWLLLGFTQKRWFVLLLKFCLRCWTSAGRQGINASNDLNTTQVKTKRRRTMS